jgi:hypothetical protein
LTANQRAPEHVGGVVGRQPASYLTLALTVLLGLSVARLWLMPLASSFWVDEMVTAFVVRQGADHASLRVAPQVPASLYYVLPRAADHFFGLSEIAYRLPSVLALGAGLFSIARLAARLIHPDSGWFAVFACMAFRGFNYQAADARPYALGTCVLAATLWLLVRWLDSGRWRHALLFAAFASVLWRIHLIFWPLYIVLATYAAVRLRRGETVVTWARAVAVFALLGLSLLPVLAEALALNREAAAHVIMPPPSLTAFTYSLKLGFVAELFAAALVLAWWLGWPRVARRISPGAFSLILGWWLCHPLALFAYSWLTGNSVFVPRYLCVALPGVGLAATAGASLYLPPRYWRAAAMLLGLGVFLSLGHWNHLWTPHHISDWREAAKQFNEVSLGPEMPVLCPSPFIEAKVPVWSPSYPLPGFLYAHLPVYEIRGKPYLLPFATSPEAERYAANLSKGVLAESARFALYGPEKSVLFWRDWLRARPALAGWRSRRLGPFGDVEVVVFEKVGFIPPTVRHGLRLRVQSFGDLRRHPLESLELLGPRLLPAVFDVRPCWCRCLPRGTPSLQIFTFNRISPRVVSERCQSNGSAVSWFSMRIHSSGRC